MRAYYQTTTRWLVIFNLPVFLTSFLLAKPLLSIFGDDFTAGATSMMILAIATLAYTCTGVGANIPDMTDVIVGNIIDMRFFPFAISLWWMTLGLIANLLNHYFETQDEVFSNRVLWTRRRIRSFDEPLLEDNGD